MDTKKSYTSQVTRYKLKNKRILITAGPTWVPVDSVRVISNIATGESGILLAERLQRSSAKVTLLLGPVKECCLNSKIRLIRFKFFEELRNIIKRELSRKKYDVIIHSAAVSDFKPEKQFKKKLSSDRIYSLNFIPLPKIIQDIRRLQPKAKLVMFKLEPGVSYKTLINTAKKALFKAGANLIVANQLNPYRAFIIDREGNTIFVRTKAELARQLIGLLNSKPITNNL